MLVAGGGETTSTTSMQVSVRMEPSAVPRKATSGWSPTVKRSARGSELLATLMSVVATRGGRDPDLVERSVTSLPPLPWNRLVARYEKLLPSKT